MTNELMHVAAVLTALLCVGCAQQGRSVGGTESRLVVPSPPPVTFSSIYPSQFKTASQTQLDMNFCVQSAYDYPARTVAPEDAVDAAYVLCMLHHGHRVRFPDGSVRTPEQYQMFPPYYEAGNMPASPRTQQSIPAPEPARPSYQAPPRAEVPPTLLPPSALPPASTKPPGAQTSTWPSPSPVAPALARAIPGGNPLDSLPLVARFKRVADRYALQLLLAAHPTARLDGHTCSTRPQDGFTSAVAIDCRTDWRDRAGNPKLIVVTYRLTISSTGVDALAIETADASAYRGAAVAKSVAIKLISDKYAKTSLVGRTALSVIDSNVTIQVAIGELLRAVVNSPDPA